MPELPEVETVCRTLEPHLVGRTLESVEIFWARTVEPAEPATFAETIHGKQVDSVFRRAKLIVFGLADGWRLSTHLRMTGNLLYVDPMSAPLAAETPGYLRVVLQLDNGGALRFYDARKFGRMRLHTPDEWLALDRDYGHEPLEPAFDAACFYKVIHARNRQIKPLLLDQTVIAGIGNIYADEALFKARIHPQQPSATISARKAAALHDAIVETLETAIRQQGTTIRNYRNALGESGTNQASLLVYGAKAGATCQRCGTMLKKLVVGQRGTTICPRCQRLR